MDWRLAKHLPIIVLNHSNNINRKWLIVFNSKQHEDEASLRKEMGNSSGVHCWMRTVSLNFAVRECKQYSMS